MSRTAFSDRAAGYHPIVDVQLTTDESAAIRKALRSYLSDLRMEIRDTDNPGYKRELREERESLESAVRKLDEVATRAPAGAGADTAADTPAVAVVELWWTTER